MLELSEFDFAPVMDYPGDLYVFDLSKGYDSDFVSSKEWAVGRYNEKRKNMYVAPQYEDERNIHMGVDIWAEAGKPVFAFWDGEIVYQRDNAQEGNYGPTIVSRHEINDQVLYALFGHLSRESLSYFTVGEKVSKGDKIAELGEEGVNGGWVPHLHFQLSVEDPGEADMPGVVAEKDLEKALKTYPDPRLVLGNLY